MPPVALDTGKSTLGVHTIEQYQPFIGEECVERIVRKAARVRGRHVVHVSSTLYGGGVAEMLTPLTLMMNAVGIETGWRVIQGTAPFFNCTKRLHNALQGENLTLSGDEKAVYEQIVMENALRLHLDDCDAVIVHDPQPLPLIKHVTDRNIPWLWQCHVDLSAPDPAVWSYLRDFVAQYDAAIVSLPEYRKELPVEQKIITPAIDPFSPKNVELTDAEIHHCLLRYQIPTDLPLIVQVSRFDRWKDPLGAIAAFRQARRKADARLVLVGSQAIDDPEGKVILDTVRNAIDAGIIVITADDPLLVNAVQRSAAVVLQKSIREGFGLTVTEAMWKGAAVIGGNVGGIRHQITDGENGFLVNSVDETAERIVQLLDDAKLRSRIGARARETVRNNFLMSRLLEDWVDVLAAMEPREQA